MKRIYCTAGLLALAGCGGDSGGVAAIPPPPPAWTGGTMTDLTKSQSFTNDTATLFGTWDPGAGTAVDGRARHEALTISYDANSQSYTLQVPGRSATFTPADIIPTADHEVIYRTERAAEDNDRLTLMLRDLELPRYVALGFWQHNFRQVADRQETEVAISAFGLPAPARAIPVSGSAEHAIMLFGLVTAPGEEPLAFGGLGRFSVTFSLPRFSVSTMLREYGLVGGHFGFGDGIGLEASGNLSSDGTFSGTATYTSQYGRSPGSINGRLYGPEAEEVGAAFATYGSDGLVAAGAFVGRQVGAQVIYPDNSSLPGMTRSNNFRALSTIDDNLYRWNETDRIVWDSSRRVNFNGTEFTDANKIPGTDQNMTAYSRRINNSDRVIQLYKFGNANNELELTCTSFGYWQDAQQNRRNDYFVYGFPTAQDRLAVQSGSARYEGVAYGTGVNSSTATKYDVKGSASFDVNFTSRSFNALLALAGSEQGSGTAVNFGDFNVSGSTKVSGQTRLEGNISQAGNAAGGFRGDFFGGGAEELSGVFKLNATAPGQPGEVLIKGATVAARR